MFTCLFITSNGPVVREKYYEQHQEEEEEEKPAVGGVNNGIPVDAQSRGPYDTEAAAATEEDQKSSDENTM